MKDSIKTRNDLLNENGFHLCEQVRHLVQLYAELSAMNLVQHDKKYNKNDNTISEIDFQDSFIESFMGL